MNDTHCKISAATLARTAALALALTNQVLSACGKPMLPSESATVEQLVTTGLTVAAALAGWWKNNSCTPVLHALIIFQMQLYGSASAEPFFVGCILQQ